MSIGERIRFLRVLRGMTQKYLGTMVGFPESTADVRLAQYEAGTRTPKEDLTKALAAALDVSPAALTVPETDSYIGLAHTLFSLEDRYGFEIDCLDGQLCIHLKPGQDEQSVFLDGLLEAWYKEASLCRNGDISKDEYDQWRYRYPETDTSGIWGKIPSKEFSDEITKSLKKKRKL